MTQFQDNFLAYDDGLITACEGVLSRWHKPKLRLTRKPKEKRLSEFYCVIDLQNHVDAKIEKLANETLPLPVLSIHPFIVPSSFFFGVRLRFDHMFEASFALTSASISVFAGQRLDPVVRAEWDRRDIGKSQHAQPHWHLLGSTLHSVPPPTFATNSSDQKTEALPFSSMQAQRTEVERIHFPMSASWQAGRPTATQHGFFKKEHLVDWLTGLTEYMEEQLRHVVSKRSINSSMIEVPAVDFAS